MSANKLDLSSLHLALDSLEVAVNRYQEVPEDEFVRDSVIQRFEYSYELCWKMLKRRLEMDAASPSEIDHLSFRDMFRIGAERGFISDPEAWFSFRYYRNMTSHTYNIQKAVEVAEHGANFLEIARNLLSQLDS